MMAQPVPHQSSDRKRVKVYELREGDWFDRGTGFCSTVVIEHNLHKEGRLVVVAEDNQDRLLLETTVTKEDGFQKQQDTLIVWTEQESGVDMALSFQEADGCASIWKFVHGMQPTPFLNEDDPSSDDASGDSNEGPALPAPDLGNLAAIEMAVRDYAAQHGARRDGIAKFIVNTGYIRKLVPLVAMAEDLESLPDLHMLCNVMKTILLLNDASIMEQAVSDECLAAVLGALEYDPDYPAHKANHRAWMSDKGRYKEVVPIADEEVVKRIHQTYRLQYMKDVVLARILDDPTFSVLHSIIFFNQVEIVRHISENENFLAKLFGIFHDSTAAAAADPAQRNDAVLFIQQCCAISKNVQPPIRQHLYGAFIKCGLNHVILFGMRHPEVRIRVAATDVLLSVMEHDPQLIRSDVYRQIEADETPLTVSLIDLLLAEVDLGIKSQASDALRVLLEPPSPPPPPPEHYARPSITDRAGAGGSTEDKQNGFIESFYESAALRLCRPLLELPAGEEEDGDMELTPQQASMLTYVIDLVSWFIRLHHDRCMLFLEQHGVISRVSALFRCREKYIQLVALRFFRQLAAYQGNMYLAEYYRRQLSEEAVLTPVLHLLVRTLPRDNLLSSACLEFFDYIRKDAGQSPFKELVENNRDKLMSLSHMETFREMILSYDRAQDEPDDDVDLYLGDDDVPEKQQQQHLKPNSRLGEHLTVDPDEENYWNGGDEDDDGEDHHHQHHRAKLGKKIPASTVNGSGSASAPTPLVDYASDDEGDENADPEAAAAAAAAAAAPDIPDAGPEDFLSETDSKPPLTAPPERLSEKRRRGDDDDDDALSGLIQDKKRRNSSSVASNASSSPSAALARQRHSSTSSPKGGTPRFSINLTNLSSALKTLGEARTNGDP